VQDLLAGKRVTYYQSLCSRYGNYSESELWDLKKDLWANRSDEYKLKWSEDEKKQKHDLLILSSRSTEEATYYAIDGANEDGMYILIAEIFGTNDLNFTKKVRRRNGKREKGYNKVPYDGDHR